jgi:translation initiation factor 2 subunit 1
MVKNKSAFPQPGELVICKIKNVQKGYVQVSLEDYAGLKNENNAQGMVHISELSNRWVKNINSIVSIGQKVVLTVLRVNEDRGYVDLSLRRVNKAQRQTKMNEWKYATKLEGLLKFFAEQHNLSIEELFEKVLFNIIDKYGDLRTAFEDIKEEGIEELNNVEDLDISDELRDDLFNLITNNITISKINLNLEFEIRTKAGDGIQKIKDAIRGATKIRKPKGIEIDFSYIGAPVYRCEIEAKDYQSAEKHLGKIREKIESIILPDGSVELIRDQLSNAQKK